MAEEFEVYLQGGSPWGFRLQGGREFRLPLKIAKVEPGGKADIAGIHVGDHVMEINEINTSSMYHTEALTAVKRAQSSLSLVLTRPDGNDVQQKPVVSKEQQKATQHAKQSSTSSTGENVPGGQGYMKKIFGSIDDLLNGYDDTTDLPPMDRDRSRTLPKKLPPRDTRMSSSSSSGSLPRTSSTSAGGGKTPNWYKQMYKEMHDSMEKESHLSKLLTSDAQRGAFRKYDGASSTSVSSTPHATQTTDNVPRRLGGGRAVATNPHRKSLPNLHASNFNFMSVANAPKTTSSKPAALEKKENEEKRERRKSINSEWYKQLQKGGDIPEAGLAVNAKANTYRTTYTAPVSSKPTQKHVVTSPVTKRAPSRDQFVPKQSSVNTEYNQPADFLELRKRELKNEEVEIERETIRQQRERERVEEEERLRKQREIDRLLIEEEEKKARLHESKIEDMVSQEIKENRQRYLNEEEEEQRAKTSINVVDNRAPDVEPEIVEIQQEEVEVEPEEAEEVFAKAKYSFHPQGPGELDFKKGQTIRILQQVDENWFEGEVNGNVGIFPVSYVLIEEVPVVVKETKKEKKQTPPATQQPPQQPSQPSIQAEPPTQPDNHGLLQEVEPIKVVEETPVNSIPDDVEEINHHKNEDEIKVTHIPGTAKARYTFRAESETELSFKKGDAISLLRQIDDNWYEGETTDGQVGIFPVNYVNVITHPEVIEEVQPKVEEIIVEKSVATQQQSAPPVDVNFEKIFDDVLQPNKSEYIEDIYEKQDIEKTPEPIQTQQTNNIDDLLGQGESFRAVFSYAATNEDEVDLEVGDVVHVLEQCDDGWFVGTSQRTGAFGTFPGNYVQAC